MITHKQVNRVFFWALIICAIGLLYAIKDSRAGFRPPSEEVQTSIPGVCLSGATVCSPDDPMIGDFNGNGELDAGDVLILQQAVMGL